MSPSSSPALAAVLARGSQTASPVDQKAGPTRAPLALALRRGALVAMPAAAGILALVGTLADPAAGLNGPELDRLYTDGMAALQIKSLAFHWSYALWTAPALLIVASIQGRGRVLANIAGVLGFLGMTTLPGMLAIDWVHSAIGQIHGPEAIGPVFALVEDQAWAFPVLQVPTMLGFVLGLPLAMTALWRAGRASWWAPAAALAAIVAFTASGVTWVGVTVTAALLMVVSVALARATRSHVA